MAEFKVTFYYGGTEATVHEAGADAHEVADRIQTNLDHSKWVVMQALTERAARVQVSSISHFVVWR